MLIFSIPFLFSSWNPSLSSEYKDPEFGSLLWDFLGFECLLSSCVFCKPHLSKRKFCALCIQIQPVNRFLSQFAFHLLNVPVFVCLFLSMFSSLSCLASYWISSYYLHRWLIPHGSCFQNQDFTETFTAWGTSLQQHRAQREPTDSASTMTFVSEGLGKDTHALDGFL